MTNPDGSGSGGGTAVGVAAGRSAAGGDAAHPGPGFPDAARHAEALIEQVGLPRARQIARFNSEMVDRGYWRAVARRVDEIAAAATDEARGWGCD